MKQQARVASHSAVARLDLSVNDVLTVALSGPATFDAIRVLRTSALEFAAGRARAVVADYRRAVMLTTPEEMDALVLGSLRYPAPDLPTALLVSWDVVDLFVAHASRVALHRIPRRVFTDPENALRWVSSKILRQAQAT